MATVNPTIYRLSDNAVRLQYSNMNTTNNLTAPIGKHWDDYVHRSVHIKGTFGANGSVTVTGSNDNGTTYTALTDPQGNAITKTSAAVEEILELTGLMLANCTAGDGNTSITVDFYLRRARSGQEI